MNYKRFEDLPVWNTAIDLAVEIYALTDAIHFRRRRSLKDQSNVLPSRFQQHCRRSAARQRVTRVQYISRGSAGEVRSMLCLLERIPRLERSTMRRCAEERAESCSRQLKAWAQSLKFEFQGERHVNQEPSE